MQSPQQATGETAGQAPGRESEGQDQRRGGALDRRYGRIGISAVAAALPYKGEDKNTVYAPTKTSTKTTR